MNALGKNILYLLKTNKSIRLLLLVALILLLAPIAFLVNKNQPTNSSSATGYEAFTKNEQINGDFAVNLAKEHYQKDYGVIRDTSFFYAELLSDGIYHVVGAEKLDGRDATFIEYDVNVETKSVKEIKPY